MVLVDMDVLMENIFALANQVEAFDRHGGLEMAVVQKEQRQRLFFDQVVYVEETASCLSVNPLTWKFVPRNFLTHRGQNPFKQWRRFTYKV